ncbi:MAG: hypothetical protein JWO33_2168 [Caulobacteraceae bacterium]|nr:hypothetical protein [Caulobacteraceae bacterium]
MTTPMPYGARRPLTEEEEGALSAGLLAALRGAGVRPRIVARPAIGARIASLWRGFTPILAWGETIFWPDALADVSLDPRRMAVLQHELQHVLEYRTGALHPLRYALSPRNWRYGYHLHEDAEWRAFGAEQRAQIVEDLWLVERGLKAGAIEWYRRIVPWA